MFGPIVPQTVAEGDLLSIDIDTSYPDGTDLTFPEEDQILPAFSQLIDNGDRKAALKITPGFEDAGDYTLTITAKDNGSPLSSNSITIMLTVTESTPDSVISYLQNQKSNLNSEDIKNLDEKISYAAQLHKYLVGAIKQERSEFQALFHGYTEDAKGLLQIGQEAEEKKIEEARQSNVDLTEDDIKKIEEKIDQSSQTKSSSQDDSGKTNNGKGNGGQGNN